jgi:hypothetical protein
MNKPLSMADRIRLLLDQGWSTQDVCDRLRVSRQRVQSADAHRQGFMGRPPLPRCEHCGGKCGGHK